MRSSLLKRETVNPKPKYSGDKAAFPALFVVISPPLAIAAPTERPSVPRQWGGRRLPRPLWPPHSRSPALFRPVRLWAPRQRAPAEHRRPRVMRFPKLSVHFCVRVNFASVTFFGVVSRFPFYLYRRPRAHKTHSHDSGHVAPRLVAGAISSTHTPVRPRRARSWGPVRGVPWPLTGAPAALAGCALCPLAAVGLGHGHRSVPSVASHKTGARPPHFSPRSFLVPVWMVS